MKNDDAILGVDLASRVSRLPREIEPPGDLWPAIAARLTREDTSLAALVQRLEPEVAPDADLWPGIQARLEEPANAVVVPRTSPVPAWFATAASVAAMAIIGSIAASMFMRSEQIAAPLGGDLWWFGATPAAAPLAGALIGQAVATLNAEIARVQSERLAIEESLQADGENLALHALWLHAYRTELELAGKAEQLIEDHQGV